MEGEMSLENLANAGKRAVKNNPLDLSDFYPGFGIFSLKDKARERKITYWQAFYMTAWHFGLSLGAIYIFKELIN